MILNIVRRTTLTAAAAVVLLAAEPNATSPKFFADDPIWHTQDTQDASNMRDREIDMFYDTAENLFASPGDHTPNVRAQNVNTIDEVPDSNWYVNRFGRYPLTTDDVLRGPDATNGPAAGQWTVIAAKRDGVTPGFTIRDSAGVVWFLKVDPPGYAGMATGTEVVATKLLWALGYHVTEVHLAQLHRDNLTIDDKATIKTEGGNRRRMRTSDIDQALKSAARDRDGSYRVIASKGIEGQRLGGFRFFGTRSDDPNDYVPHEHRRELRGYGTFAAWLNHVDSKSINTFDALVSDGERAVVKHYLLDFGSSLGSAGVYPREPFEGTEYLVDGKRALAGIPALGFYLPSWRTMPMYRAASVGAFPSKNASWNPEYWKPRIPNPAFVRARADDKFWAARKLQALSPEMIREVVTLGRFRDERSEIALAKFLIERRQAILRTYLVGINPVVDPTLDASGALTFSNAAVDAGVAEPPARGYVADWFRFDNATGTATPAGTTDGVGTTLNAPSDLLAASGDYVKVQIRAVGGAHSSWAIPVHVYFVREGNSYRLVGFERLPDGGVKP